VDLILNLLTLAFTAIMLIIPLLRDIKIIREIRNRKGAIIRIEKGGLTKAGRVFIIVFGLSIMVGIWKTITDETSKKWDSQYTFNQGSIDGQLDDITVTYPELESGGTGFKTLAPAGEPFFKMPGWDLTIFIQKHQLFLSTTLRDSLGHIIARIKENEWDIKLTSGYEKNFDSKGFEIRDDAGRVILHADFKRTAVEVAGIFYDSLGHGFEIRPKPGPEGGAEVQLKTSRDSTYPYGHRMKFKYEYIPPIFKYPATLHKGERL
jgi:hypothetical protein